MNFNDRTMRIEPGEHTITITTADSQVLTAKFVIGDDYQTAGVATASIAAEPAMFRMAAPTTTSVDKAETEEPTTEDSDKVEAEEPTTEDSDKVEAEEPTTEDSDKAETEEPTTEGSDKVETEETEK